jgi:dsDNA-binding SOS-regulon protein
MKRRIFVLFILCVCGVSLLTGCESLRKKFTRKKKSTETQEVMIITPRDYSAHPFTSDVLYKQYFIYWKSWNQELITSLTDGSSYKKVLDCVDQSLVNIKKMETYLKEDKAKELEVYVKKTEDLKNQIMESKSLPSAFVNNLRYSAERILSSVNRLFDLSKMKDHLK